MKNKRLFHAGRSAGLSLLLMFLLGTNAVIGQIAYWNCGAQSSWGTSPLPATTANANLTVGPLTRGAGLTTSGAAAANAWGANGWDNNEPADDFSWTLTANSGYQQSLTNIVFYYRRSNPSGPNQVTFFYSLDGGSDVEIGQFATTATATGGTPVTVPLSGIAELQNVPAGTVVKFRMTAQNATGPSATFYYNNTNGLKVNGTVTAAAVPCTAPSGLASDNITDVSADLSWTVQAGVSGYEYAIDQNATAPASGTATTSIGVTESGLTASTTYYLHVRTDCGSGNVSPWTTISFTTLVTPCAAPSGLAASNVTDVSADLSWTAQAGVIGYEYAIDQNATAPASGTATTSTGVTESGLTASTTYYLHVRTDCGSGNVSPWTTISFTTLVTPCAAPSGLSASNITDDGATLSWGMQAGIEGYEYVIDQNAGDPAGAGTATVSTTVPQAGLSPSTTYYLHVRVDCGSNYSTWATIPFQTAAPCPAPTGLNATAITGTSVSLSWTAQGGVDGYQYAVTGTQTPPATGEATTSAAVNESGLTHWTTYYLHVRTDCGGYFSNWTTFSFSTTSSVGVEEFSAELFTVYPNPATDELMIETNGEAVVTLLDVNGKQLKTISLSNKAVISVADLEAGVYFLHFVQHGKRAVRKIAKQ